MHSEQNLHCYLTNDTRTSGSGLAGSKMASCTHPPICVLFLCVLMTFCHLLNCLGFMVWTECFAVSHLILFLLVESGCKKGMVHLLQRGTTLFSFSLSLYAAYIYETSHFLCGPWGQKSLFKYYPVKSLNKAHSGASHTRMTPANQAQTSEIEHAPTHNTGHWVHSYPCLNQACRTIAVFSIEFWTTWLIPWLCSVLWVRLPTQV